VSDDSPDVSYIDYIHLILYEEPVAMSIVRMGMSEDGKFGDGYDAIFRKKKAAEKPAAKAKPAGKKPAKKAAKKK
jgi:hypothetical protein